MERAQLEQERLSRLKRLCREPHPQSTEPPLKRPAPSRERNSTSTLEAGPSRRRGGETVDESAEVFWDGELRQTANAHVEIGHNGENGRPVFRLSQIIGDVSPVFLPSPASHLLKGPDLEITGRTSHYLDVRPPAFLDLSLFCSQHSRYTCYPTCAVREWGCDHKRGASKLDSCYAVLARWTWGDAHEGAS